MCRGTLGGERWKLELNHGGEGGGGGVPGGGGGVISRPLAINLASRFLVAVGPRFRMSGRSRLSPRRTPPALTPPPKSVSPHPPSHVPSKLA